MSHSYKKNPVGGLSNDTNAKKQANKRLRKLPLNEDFSNSSYKKYYPSWEICDYKTYHELDKDSSLEELRDYKFK